MYLSILEITGKKKKKRNHWDIHDQELYNNGLECLS